MDQNKSNGGREMKQGNKIIRCGICGSRIVAKMAGETGYAVCKCTAEYRVTNDHYYGITAKLAVLPKQAAGK